MDIAFNKKRRTSNKQEVDKLKHKFRKSIFRRGAKKKNCPHNMKKGKLTARERIDYLIDDGSEFLEVGAFCCRWHV